MQIPKNKFKASLISGKTSYGIWNGIPDTYVAEICAGAGFDWVLLDAEHGPFDLKTLILSMQAIAPYEVQTLIRPPEANPVLIKQLLDAGIQSLIVPMVETAEQAEEIVKAMRYPPQGMRGVGTALARAARWNRVDNYFQEANEEMCLIVQVESVRGLDNLTKIAQVEGVDGVFIGPADLAASMGLLGQPANPLVVQEVEKALAQIRSLGKAAGVMAIAPNLARQYIDKGANIVAVGIDTLLLAKATRTLAEEFKPELRNDISSTKY